MKRSLPIIVFGIYFSFMVNKILNNAEMTFPSSTMKRSPINNKNPKAQFFVLISAF